MYSMTKSTDAVCHIARSIYVNRCFFFSCGFDFIIIMYSILANVVDVFVCDAFDISVAVCSEL